MNFKSTVILISVVALAFGGYWLYSNVPYYGLVNADEYGNTAVVAVGWPVYWKGLFFLIPSLVTGLFFSLIFLGWLYGKADHSDHQAELSKQKKMLGHRIQELEAQAKTLKERANDAEENARSKYERQEAQLLAKAQDLVKLKSDSEALKKLAESELKEANEIRNQAAIDVQRAQKKQRNASGAHQRLKRRRDAEKAEKSENKEVS